MAPKEGEVAAVAAGGCAEGGEGWWQTACGGLSSRLGAVRARGLWADCEVLVGAGRTPLAAHRVLLAAASPVLAAMLYGPLAKADQPVTLPDLEPHIAHLLLEYMYTDNITISSCDVACSLYKAAHYLILPQVEAVCTAYLVNNINPKNVIPIYELGKLYDNKEVKEKCLNLMSKRTSAVLKRVERMSAETLKDLFALPSLAIVSELELFHAAKRWLRSAFKKNDSNSCGNDATDTDVSVGSGHASGAGSGHASVATGDASVVTGDSSVDTGDASVATGDASVDTGEITVDTGKATVDTGKAAVDTGDASAATGDASVDTGDTSVATGDASVATGNASVDTGDASVATGDASVDTGDASVATGNASVATGDASVATEDASVATGDASVDTGDASVDTGDASVDTGVANVATADARVYISGVSNSDSSTSETGNEAIGTRDAGNDSNSKDSNISTTATVVNTIIIKDGTDVNHTGLRKSDANLVLENLETRKVDAKELVRDAVKKIRFLTLDPEEFVLCDTSALLSDSEKLAILKQKLEPLTCMADGLSSRSIRNKDNIFTVDMKACKLRETSTLKYEIQNFSWNLSNDYNDEDKPCLWLDCAVAENVTNDWFCDAKFQVKVLPQRRGLPIQIAKDSNVFTRSKDYCQLLSLDWETLSNLDHEYVQDGKITFEVAVSVVEASDISEKPSEKVAT